ncbi:hypothetical protein [Kitasatospora sp. KL5]|uniref:hypothetical protein n=1 Tax=Kitasatospora sp. KL5 TaxID=3425125 RepID=UPI003D6F6B2A
MELRTDYTDDQRKAIDEVKAELEELITAQIQQAHADARNKLSARGVHLDPDGTYCLNCLDSPTPCNQYRHGPMGLCKKHTCRHFLLDHNMPM